MDLKIDASGLLGSGNALIILPLIGKVSKINPSVKFFVSVTNGSMSLHVIPVALSDSRTLMIELEDLPSFGITFKSNLIG
jgi:hypothetical protein